MSCLASISTVISSPVLQAVEELRSRQNTPDRRTSCGPSRTCRNTSGIHQITHQIRTRSARGRSSSQTFAAFLQIDRRQVLAGTARASARCRAGSTRCNVRRPSAFGLAQRPDEHVDDRVRQASDCDPAAASSKSSTVMSWLTRKIARSPTTLLDGVTFTMSPKAMFTSAYVRAISCQRAPRPIDSACSFRFVYCPPGISCRYTSRRAGLRRVVERRVVVAHVFPIVARIDSARRDRARYRAACCQRRDDGVQIRLAGRAAHRGDRAVGDVHAGLGGLQNGGRIDAAGVVRVEVNRQCRSLRAAPSPACTPRTACSSPAMSLMARICAPIFSSSFAIRT